MSDRATEPELLDPPAWQLRRDDETRDEYVERMIELARAHLAAAARTKR